MNIRSFAHLVAHLPEKDRIAVKTILAQVENEMRPEVFRVVRDVMVSTDEPMNYTQLLAQRDRAYMDRLPRHIDMARSIRAIDNRIAAAVDESVLSAEARRKLAVQLHVCAFAADFGHCASQIPKNRIQRPALSRSARAEGMPVELWEKLIGSSQNGNGTAR